MHSGLFCQIWFANMVSPATLGDAIKLSDSYLVRININSLIELMNCHCSVSETLQNMKFLVHVNDLGKKFN